MFLNYELKPDDATHLADLVTAVDGLEGFCLEREPEIQGMAPCVIDGLYELYRLRAHLAHIPRIFGSENE